MLTDFDELLKFVAEMLSSLLVALEGIPSHWMLIRQLTAQTEALSVCPKSRCFSRPVRDELSWCLSTTPCSGSGMARSGPVKLVATISGSSDWMHYRGRVTV